MGDARRVRAARRDVRRVPVSRHPSDVTVQPGRQSPWQALAWRGRNLAPAGTPSAARPRMCRGDQCPVDVADGCAVDGVPSMPAVESPQAKVEMTRRRGTDSDRPRKVRMRRLVGVHQRQPIPMASAPTSRPGVGRRLAVEVQHRAIRRGHRVQSARRPDPAHPAR